MEHPWGRLRELGDWLIGWAHLPVDLVGITHHNARVIILDKRLLQAERRCTLAHELEHVARGPMPADPVLAAREEASIDEAVARRLISLRALGDALAWSREPHEAAELLWVDVPTLRARLASLEPAERAYLIQRTEHHGCS